MLLSTTLCIRNSVKLTVRPNVASKEIRQNAGEWLANYSRMYNISLTCPLTNIKITQFAIKSDGIKFS
jgi:hypothetical protein